MAVHLADICLRPEKPEDELFLLEVYISTRKEEMEAVDWPPEMRTAFLRMQFHAQQRGQRADSPAAEFAIVMSAGQAIGRIVVDRAQHEFRLVDIALLPAWRGAGIGTALVQGLQREAAAAKKRVQLSVLTNHRAARLYQRLGFAKTGGDGVRDRMEWQGEALPP
ncbi:MAG TPA: GNAT family N-acetyltransferase [Verrucomicrobiae bacterium]|jgi:ribosomal protein S18 acetylase RimI-like enzyme